MLRGSKERKLADIAALVAEDAEINDALPLLVNEPTRAAEAEFRLREIAVLLPCERRALEAIEKAIPDAEDRERRERIQVEIDEQARKSARLQRGLEARYTKAAEAFAEVCREIQADREAWSHLRLNADTVKPRVPTPHKTAEMELRYDKFASPNYGLKSVTEDLTVRAWDGSTLFRS
jgi:hypothetical protein